MTARSPASARGDPASKGSAATQTQGAGGVAVAFPHTPWLDQPRRAQHVYLDGTDICWVLASYRPGTYRRGDLNQLIANFKCRPSIAAAHPVRGHYKQRAISAIAAALRRRLDRESVEAATWVPVPPSRRIGSPDYDDRLIATLWQAFRGYDLDVRALLQQTDSTPSDHEVTGRLSAPALHALLRVDTALVQAMPLRTRLILFDDVLTTGKHFKCCQLRLREVAPKIPICGWFVARRVICSRWCGASALYPGCRGC